MMQFKRYTQEQFIEAITTSFSLASALKKLNIAPHGGNYSTAKSYIKQLNLDISHFTGQLWSKGKKLTPKRDISCYLSNEFPISSDRLRRRLLSEKIFSHKCSCCQLSNWLDKPIPLEIHHKDGNNKNNNLDNLCLLCPNCHAQTPNYRGANKKPK